MVGAGVIGSSVAHLFAITGHEVVLIDTDGEQLKTARRSIGTNVRMYGLLQKGARLPGAVLDRLEFSGDVRRLAGASFVVENITENWELKRRVHQEIDEAVAPEIPLAANTSAIPITRIASANHRPERVLGMHFMNPVPLMPVVELIRGERTSEETIVAARSLLAQAGRHSILVNDSPGFVTNRVMMLMVNEAMFLVHEGVSNAQDVDRLFKTCFGHKMGPLETADLIGLDTVLKSLEVIYEELNDSKYRPCPLLKKMVYAGRTGTKSGQGFYRYQS